MPPELDPLAADFWIRVGTAFLWRAILEQLRVRGPVALLSYILLFVSVCNLKLPGFYVTIGDVQMTLCGTVFLHLFLTSRQRTLVPAGFLSGFVRSGLPQDPSGRWSCSRNLIPRWMALAICSAVGGVTGAGLGPLVASGEILISSAVVVALSFVAACDGNTK